MAHPLDPKTIVPSQDFDLKGNPEANNRQANETFLVTSFGGNVLGNEGQVKGYAKYQYNPDMTLQDRKNEVEKRAKELENEPLVQDFLQAQRAIATTTAEIKAAQTKLDGLLHLPTDDPVRMGAEQDLNDFKVNVDKAQRNLDFEGQKPEVQEYLKAADETNQLFAKIAQQTGAVNSSSALYKKKDRTAMNATNGDPLAGGDRSLLARSVASKTVDNFLGTDVLSEEKFGVDKNGRPIGISVQVEGAGVTGQFGGKTSFLDVDYSDPQIQRGLSDLEVNDFITGQIDRHTGNIYIDPVTKKVMGIDNDLAFPACTREEAIANQLAFDKVVQGLPKTVHKETAERILKLNPDDLRRQLEEMPAPDGVGKLSNDSINGAVDRLKKLQAGLAPGGKIKVVDKFDKQTYDAAVKEQNDEVVNRCGKDLSKCGVEDSAAQKADRTSYLGSALLAQHMTENGIQHEPDKFAKRSVTTVAKMERDPRYEAYLKMNAPQKAEYDKISGEIGDLDKQLSDSRQKQAALQATPHGMKAVTAFFQKDKVDKQLLALRKQEGDCLQGIQDKVLQLDSMTKAFQKATQKVGQKNPSPTDHSVRGELQHEHVEVGASVTQSVKAGQQQKTEEHHSLRKDHPELVHQGQKVTGPHPGQHV